MAAYRRADVQERPGHFVWQHASYASDNWHDFSPDNNQLAHDAYARGSRTKNILVGDTMYELDFLALTQRSLTGFNTYRRIRLARKVQQPAQFGGSQDQDRRQENRYHDVHRPAQPVDLSKVAIRAASEHSPPYSIGQLPQLRKDRTDALVRIYVERFLRGTRSLQVPYCRAVADLLKEDTGVVLDAVSEAIAQARIVDPVDLTCYEPDFLRELRDAKSRREEPQAQRRRNSAPDVFARDPYSTVQPVEAPRQHHHSYADGVNPNLPPHQREVWRPARDQPRNDHNAWIEAPRRPENERRLRDHSTPAPAVVTPAPGGEQNRRARTPGPDGRPGVLAALLGVRFAPPDRNRGTSPQDSARRPAMTPSEELVCLVQMVHPHIRNHQLTLGRVSAQTWNVTTNEAGLAATVSSLAKKVAEKLHDTHRGTCEFCVSGHGVPPEAVVAAISLGLLMAAVKRRVQFKVELNGGFDERAFKQAWDQAEAPQDVLPLYEDVRSNRPYDWVQKDTSADSRLKRLATAFFSLAYGGSFEDVENVERVLAADCSRLGDPGRPRVRVDHDGRPCADVAMAAKGRGKRVAVVNAASAYNPGGGFLTGGRHALEEAMCMQSTLIYSLLAAARASCYDNGASWSGKYPHIPQDGALLSRNVTFFREGTSKGYKPLDNLVTLDAVISVAMPCRSRTVHDSPIEFEFREDAEYERRVWNKLSAVVHAAEKAHVQVLVIPDVGCGVFGNKPETVGKILGRVLAGYRGSVQEVIFTGQDIFFSAVLQSGGFDCGTAAPQRTQLLMQ